MFEPRPHSSETDLVVMGKWKGCFLIFRKGTSDATRYIASASRSLDHQKALRFQVHVGVAGNATVEIEMLEITRGS